MRRRLPIAIARSRSRCWWRSRARSRRRAAPAAVSMYAEALAREQAVRAALAATGPQAAALKAVRDGRRRLRERSSAATPPAATATTRCGRRAGSSLDAFARFGDARATSETARPAAADARWRRYPDEHARRSRSPGRARAIRRGRSRPPRRAGDRRRPVADPPLGASDAARLDELVTIKAFGARCCPTSCASRSSWTREVPFHDERIDEPDPRLRRSAGDARGRRRWSIRRSASTATPTSCGRCASAGTRTAPRASCSTPPASRATASIRSTARTAW